ncbi:MAG: family 78 glycoside hydrolase catalytic domain, partial [Prevotellaceae bacterium]|nr:family 78 glycoside hydrolase catalytic domain [Prevotellaceae bacterium]
MKKISTLLLAALLSIGAYAQVDWKAQWIGLDKAFAWDVEDSHSRLSARYLRKEFDLKKEVKSAKVSLVGLGLYELYINGEKIDDHVLAPTPTDYNKSVKYNEFDVTAQVKKGKNAVGVILGTGHYYNNRQNTKLHKHKLFGYPKLLLQLEITFADGAKQTVVSDQTWRLTNDGAIRSTNDYDGEIYDATKEFPSWTKVGFNDKKWLKPELVKAPTGEISLQKNPNMKVMQTLEPKSISHLAGDTFIMDMGQNMVGWLQFTARGGKRGQKISLRFAETLDTTGRLKTINLRSAQQHDIYTMKGDATETWEPRFVTHGFRFAEVVGFPQKPEVKDFVGKVVYDEMETIGAFESSNATLNQIVKNAWWGISGNYKGIPLDCPQRDERQPWLGDHAVGSIGESFLFDNKLLYEKWLDDIRDTQRDSGPISDIAPAYYMTYFSDNMTWTSAYFMVADMLWKQFGETEPIARHYPYMKKWLNYMKKYMTPEYIVTKDKYGDWCVPPEAKELIHSQDPARKTDGQLIATAYYYKLLHMMMQFAPLADARDDVREFAPLAENIKKAFNKKFYNEEKGFYGNNSVTSNLLPLAFGMVERQNENRVFQSMLSKIAENKMHISTGVIGTQWLMRELTKRGRADVAYTIASQKTYPGWGYMVESGATTIWELWNGDTASPKMNSHNHVMALGDLLTWVFEDLAGIKSHPTYKGFRWLWMQPHPTEDLNFVKASYKTPNGIAKSEWKLDKGNFTWKITIPKDSRANILVPAKSVEDIKLNGQMPLNMKAAGVKFVRYEKGRVNLELPAGDYTVECLYGVAQDRWKKGVEVDEFIFEKTSFPESHAATIALNKDGNLIASWFGGTKERNPDVCIWTSTRVNGKWSEPVNVANGIVNDTLRYATWNPVLYQVPNGELQLYYKVGPNVAGWVGKVIRSQDGGKTWSKPEDLPEGFLGPIKNKPVMLKDGRLIAPSSREGKGGWRTLLEESKDKGKTWTKITNVGGGDGSQFGIIQPSLLTYPDGRMQVICRSRNRALVESWSKDGGKTWGALQASALPGTNSGTDAVTLLDGRQLLVYNHVLPDSGARNGKGARTPLNVALTEDGKTWHAALVLEDSPISQYSYPSVIQTPDGMVHIVYTWRRKRIKYVQVDLKKLVFSKIEDKKWPSANETKEIQVVNNNRYKVSACDWMMLKRQKIGAIDLAADINADGLEIDMGGLGKREKFDNKFTDKAFVDLFISECNRRGIEFSSMALSAFYGQSFAKRENYEALIDEAISSMVALGIKRAFLPMGNASDIVKEPELYPIIVNRLKIVAKKAEAAGVIFGIETALDAKGEAKLIDEIGSPAIKSYVNFNTIISRGGDVIKDLKTLGKNRIMQIHVSNTDGHWIQNDPALDMKKVKETLDKMGWSGWLVVERSRDTKDVHNVKWNYGANVKYLK